MRTVMFFRALVIAAAATVVSAHGASIEGNQITANFQYIGYEPSPGSSRTTTILGPVQVYEENPFFEAQAIFTVDMTFDSLTVSFPQLFHWGPLDQRGITLVNLSGDFPDEYLPVANADFPDILSNGHYSTVGNTFTLEFRDLKFPAGSALTFAFAPVSAVPEPEALTMLLAGLGLVGALARRVGRRGWQVQAPLRSA